MTQYPNFSSDLSMLKHVISTMGTLQAHTGELDGAVSAFVHNIESGFQSVVSDLNSLQATVEEQQQTIENLEARIVKFVAREVDMVVSGVPVKDRPSARGGLSRIDDDGNST